MGVVLHIADFMSRKRDAVAEADREMLHMEFSKAASLLRNPDLHTLASRTSYHHAHFAFNHAQAMASHIERAFPGIHAHAIELEACRTLTEITRSAVQELKDGVSLPVLRKVWNRSVDAMIDRLTETALTLIPPHGPSRSDAPNPRSA